MYDLTRQRVFRDKNNPVASIFLSTLSLRSYSLLSGFKFKEHQQKRYKYGFLETRLGFYCGDSREIKSSRLEHDFDCPNARCCRCGKKASPFHKIHYGLCENCRKEERIGDIQDGRKFFESNKHETVSFLRWWQTPEQLARRRIIETITTA